MPNISELYQAPLRKFIEYNFSRYGLHPFCQSCPLGQDCKDRIYDAPGLTLFKCYLRGGGG